MSKTDYKVIIVGTGFAGLGMGIKLKEAGYDDFLILERASEVGGTWRDNHYPGCACDVPSHLYSFSFEQNPDWSRRYASWSEIGQYLRDTTQKYGLYPHIQFNAAMKSARYDEAKGIWTVDTGETTYTAQIVVSAVGPLSNAAYPNVKGLNKFKGKTFHSADWDHDYDLKGKKVAVIGTGASAIQFVPEVAKVAGEMTLF
ncbi:MAG: NAD(P)/FAD-dependent oxidoreductase, partial [Pseudomonadales bacterium]|nr:NAD(P)/FAD-dependent oxidoreductase [Pseudomonadales bacterium]